MEEMDILKKAGLSEAQAVVYNCLLQNGALTPTELADYTKQSRENCYAVAKRLVELGIIEETEDKKKKYRVLNPSALETLVEKRRKVMVKNEKFVITQFFVCMIFHICLCKNSSFHVLIWPLTMCLIDILSH